MSAMDPTRIVRAGLRPPRRHVYRRLGRARCMDSPRRAFLGDVLERHPAGLPTSSSRVRAGHGCGSARGRAADTRASIFSGRAARTCPCSSCRTGTFLQADVLEVAAPSRRASMPSSAFYVFDHIPAGQDRWLFRSHLSGGSDPGGWLFASFGTSDNPGEVEERCGWVVADMYFSSLPPEQTDELLRSAGFDIRSSETIEEVEPGEGPVAFRWVIDPAIGARADDPRRRGGSDADALSRLPRGEGRARDGPAHAARGSGRRVTRTRPRASRGPMRGRSRCVASSATQFMSPQLVTTRARASPSRSAVLPSHRRRSRPGRWRCCSSAGTGCSASALRTATWTVPVLVQHEFSAAACRSARRTRRSRRCRPGSRGPPSDPAQEPPRPARPVRTESETGSPAPPRRRRCRGT